MLRKLDNIPVNVTFDRALERLKIEEAEDIELISGLFERAKEIARPKVLYREAFVEKIEGPDVVIDKTEFKSAVLAAALSDVHRVFAYVCTCGAEVDEWSHKEKDYVVSLWLDMIKEMFLGEAGAFLWDHLKNSYQFKNLSSVNPGSGNVENWDISQQKQLFALVGPVKEEIGVTLTDSFLMLPTKSTSGLLFPVDSEAGFVNCALCTRKNCVGRRAAFDKELYDSIFDAG
ncbi:MAG: vitamin B12 dependent methionine synthase [Oscillospiraceae bacterium]|nr:vitamin B12 dependent methionine synthase [Oscillospiraceae bacterium]